MRERPDALTVRIAELCTQYLRTPTGMWLEEEGPAFEFMPPLTEAEGGVFLDLAAMARHKVTLTLGEFQSLKDDLRRERGVINALQGTVLTPAENLALHQSHARIALALIADR